MNDRRQLRGTTAASLAVGMLTAVLALDALAQPKPALTRNVDEPGRNPYVRSMQVVQNTTNCSAALDQCAATFLVVPDGKRLVITYVSVAFFLAAGGNAPEASLSAAGTGFILLPQPTKMTFGVDRYTVATPVTFYVEPGESPRVIMRGFNFADGYTFTVALAGYLVALP
jgi:hypothetical protein